MLRKNNILIIFSLFLIILIIGCNSFSFFSNNKKQTNTKKFKFLVKRKIKKNKKKTNLTNNKNNKKKNLKKFVYDPELIKRNPFEPFIKKIEQPVLPEKVIITPLTEYSINQYKFVAVITDKKPPLGMVETEDKNGLIFTIGDYIGSEMYKVVKITPNKIILIRKFYDFFKKLRTEKKVINLENTGE